MPTNPTPPSNLTAEGNEIIGAPIGLKEIAVLLVKHYELHDGLYDPVIQFTFGVTGLEFPNQGRVPAGLVGVSHVGLSRAKEVGSNTVDAAAVNPAPVKASGKTTSENKAVIKKAAPRK